MLSTSNKLNQRAHAFALVLNDNELHLFKNSDNIKKVFLKTGYFDFIAVMFHDSDIDYENNVCKTPHYHVVAVLKNNDQMRLCTMVNIISDTTHCNVNQISIEKCNDISSSVRYLIHMDDPEKWQYLPFDIVTNKQIQVTKYLSRVPVVTDLEEIISLTKRFNYDIEKIATTLGEKNWKKYGYFVIQLKRDRLSYGC